MAENFTPEELAGELEDMPVPLEQSEWHVYNVLLIDDDEEIAGVSRRAGLGKIYILSFDDACLMDSHPQTRKHWKEIILG